MEITQAPNIPIIRLEDVTLKFGQGIPVFKGLNLSIPAGSFHFLTGPSGAGKSSLLKLLYFAARPTNGAVYLFGHNTLEVERREIPNFLRRVGVVFQDFRLLNHLTALENVALPLKVRGVHSLQAREQAAELLNWVGLDGHLDSFPPSLSGGQQQRIVIARAVVTRPQILLADEPTGNVDDEIAMRLLFLFEELHKAGTTVLIATHNRTLAHQFPHPEIHLEENHLTLDRHLKDAEEQLKKQS